MPIVFDPVKNLSKANIYLEQWLLFNLFELILNLFFACFRFSINDFFLVNDKNEKENLEKALCSFQGFFLKTQK